MGITHIRLPKNFVLEERLERYADAIETNGRTYAGHWAHACWPLPADRSEALEADRPQSFRAVKLDLGCGKGSFLAQAAQREPDTLFLGMDIEAVCIAYAAQLLCERKIANALILPRSAQALPQLFAAGELAGITINFPTPCPRRRHAHRRLVNVDHLLGYRPFLADGATVVLRTDSQPLRDYAKGQFAAAGYRTCWISDNCRADHPEFPVTEYESRLIEAGARVYALCATPGPEPSPEQVECGRSAEQGLMNYLPDDLFSLDYVPYGMEAAVENARNRIKNGRSATPH